MKVNSLEPLNQWCSRKAFAARKAFCTVPFTRDTHSARCLQAWLDLTINTRGTECPCLPKEHGRLLRPSCIILMGSWTLVSESQKPAWPWAAETSFCETGEWKHGVLVSGETAELAERLMMSFSRLPFWQEMWQCVWKFITSFLNWVFAGVGGAAEASSFYCSLN